MAAKVAAIPDVPATIDPGVARVLRALKEIAEVREGRRPNQSALDRLVTFRDLVDPSIGVFGVGKGGRIVPGTGSGGSASGTSVQPPQLAGFTANGAFASIILAWDDPNRLFAAYAYTEIWRATVNDRSQAVRVGTSSSFVWPDTNVMPGPTYYYWGRLVSTSGQIGAFNAGPTEGTPASVALDAGYVLDQLTTKPWAASTYYSAFTAVAPSTAVVIDGVTVSFQAQNAGTSGATEPDWTTVTVIGGTLADGTITWAAIDAHQAPFVTGSINGHPVVYMPGAVLKDLSVENEKVENLAADKLFAVTGTIAQVLIGDADITNAMIGNTIQSTNYNAGISGWLIEKTGFAEFNGPILGTDAIFSGELDAATGTFSGSLTAQAVNAVDTLNIRGDAVTVPVAIAPNYSAAPATGTAVAYYTIGSVSWTSEGGHPIAISADLYRTAAVYSNNTLTMGTRIIVNGSVMNQYAAQMGLNYPVYLTRGLGAGASVNGATSVAVENAVIANATSRAGGNTLTIEIAVVSTSSDCLLTVEGTVIAREAKR